MSTNITAFLPWVMPQVPGCPDILALKALRDCLTDFTQKTDLVQRVLSADCTIGVEDYVITPPADMLLTRILSVGYQGTSLKPVSPDVVNSDVVLRGAAVGAATPSTGNPTWYFQKTPYDNGFSIYPIPAATVTLGLTVKASFQVIQTATTCEDALFSDWVDEIAAGAIASLMAMPGQPFSSSSDKYSQQYVRAISRGLHKKNSGALPASLRVMPVRFV